MLTLAFRIRLEFYPRLSTYFSRYDLSSTHFRLTSVFSYFRVLELPCCASYLRNKHDAYNNIGTKIQNVQKCIYYHFLKLFIIAV